MIVKIGTNKKKSCILLLERRKEAWRVFSDQNSIAYYKLKDTELLSQFNVFSLNRHNYWEVLLNRTYRENDIPTTENHAVDSLTLVYME